MLGGWRNSLTAATVTDRRNALRFAAVTRPSLHVQLECELPGEVAVGLGTAVFICGWCYCPEARVTGLEFVVGDELQPVAAHGMPRLDPFRALHPTLDPFTTDGLRGDPESAQDPHLYGYRTGFWGFVTLRPGRLDEPLELTLRARLESGEQVDARLATLAPRARVTPFPVSWPDPTVDPRVAIAMATHNPPPELLARQLDSIRAQTHDNWVCVISDDCSGPEALAAIERAIAGDARFVLSRSPQRLGFYRNFERALELVPADARYVALADQDDAWRPEKLEVLLGALGEAQLVYSDARVVARDGRVLSDTWWDRRRNNHEDLLSLLVANAVTGAASLFRRELLDYALPFPPAQFAHFHDHWIGLVAVTLGEITYVPRPLYDYFQHGQAALGHAAANRMPSLRDRLTHRRALHDRVRMWRLHYFVDICRLQQFATVLLLRCGRRAPAAKRRTLERFLGAERSLPQLATLGARGARELLGTPETLGAEWMLLHALAWRRLVDLTARDRPQARLRLDALPPPTLIQQPGARGLPADVAAIADKVAPLRWAVSEDAPRRINLLIPTIDLEHFFGGYIAKFSLARRLAERGWRVRIVTVDPVGPLTGDWRRRVAAYEGLGDVFSELEVAFGRESAALEVSPTDGFIATTWWTAHIASDALRSLGGGRFLYLIQEYEPFTFAMGSYAALAAESYGLDHFALFSSELLRGYFRAHGIGVYAAGKADGDSNSASFQNAITPVPAPSAAELEARPTRRLLFYARPESHAARNMFELGVLALSRVLQDGVLADGWELNGVGAVGRGSSISLGNGYALRLRPRLDQRAYAAVLREHDVGLALMYTPHPSLVPIEMASAAMVTVTNTFENKTADAMAAISANLLAVGPSVDSIAAGLREAAALSGDYAARAAASRVRWSTNWADSFDDALVDRIGSAVWAR
jgi:glycosyltransferase involved in cell wall biosynthesis